MTPPPPHVYAGENERYGHQSRPCAAAPCCAGSGVTSMTSSGIGRDSGAGSFISSTASPNYASAAQILQRLWRKVADSHSKSIESLCLMQSAQRHSCQIEGEPHIVRSCLRPQETHSRFRQWHPVFQRVSAITCGYKDENDLDRLRYDSLMKATTGRCPETGVPLASQSTISRLENSPRKADAARIANCHGS
jgi:hypothetical protein